MDATTLHVWGRYGQVEIKSCRVAGVEGSGGERYYQQHTLVSCTLSYVPLVGFCVPPRCGSGGLVLASPSTARLAGRMGWGRRLKREVKY